MTKRRAAMLKYLSEHTVGELDTSIAQATGRYHEMPKVRAELAQMAKTGLIKSAEVNGNPWYYPAWRKV